MIGDAQQAAARPPDDERAPPPRWTLRRLMHWGEQRFGRRFCRETRAASPEAVLEESEEAAGPTRRQAFLEDLAPVLDGAARDRHLLVCVDQAHIHQDADLGYGWSARGQPAWVCSTSPGLSAKRTFYGLSLYNDGQVRLWPYPRGNGEHTIDVLGRLRAEFPEHQLIVLWDGVSYHRAESVRQAAAELKIECRQRPGYSPDVMPVEPLWRWLREDGTDQHCHASLDGLETSRANFQDKINQDPIALADRLALTTQLDPDVEKLRIPN